MSSKWFTLIELMVVVSIIWVISVVGVFSFLGTAKQQSLRQELFFLEKIIAENDQNIGKSLTDYRVDFFVDSPYYVLSSNESYKEEIQKITFDAFTWTLSTTSGEEGLYMVKIYRNWKFLTQELLNSTGSYQIDFSQWGNYKIFWYLNQKPINILEVRFYTQFEMLDESEKIFLRALNTTFQSGSVSHTLTKRKKFVQNTTQTGTLFLEFEKNGTQTSLSFK